MLADVGRVAQSKRLQGWVLFDWLNKDGEDSAKKKLQEVPPQTQPTLAFTCTASACTAFWLDRTALVMKVSMESCTLQHHRSGASFLLCKVWDLFLDGTIQPYTGEVYPLEQWAEAVEASIKTGRGGKVLLEG